MRTCAKIATILITALCFISLFRFAPAFAEEGHPSDHTALYQIVHVPATCYEDEYYMRVCEYVSSDGDVCGYIDPEYGDGGKRIVEGTKLEHLILTEDVDATCWHYKGTRYYCTRPDCGWEYIVYSSDDPDSENYEEDLVYTDHTWVYDDEKNVTASCTESGYFYRHCSVCESVGIETVEEYEIAPLGHDYIYDYEEKNESGESIRHYRCSRCGDTGYSVNLGIVSNETASSLLELFDKYWYWIWILLGSFIIIWGIYIGIRYATAQTDDDAAYARISLKEFFIGILVIAVLCVGVPYLIWGVALWIG